MKTILMLCLFAGVCLGASGQALHAGAWLRDEKTGFLSLAFKVYKDDALGGLISEQSIFLEYGLRPNLTIGAAINYTSTSEADGHIFLRRPILNSPIGGNMAYEIGLGTEMRATGTDGFLRGGVSWGKGMKFGQRNGWSNVDIVLQIPASGQGPLLKIDGTLGVTLGPRFQAMGQIFLEADEFGESATLRPSVIYHLKKTSVKFVAGLDHRMGRSSHTALNVGFWRDF